MTLPIQELNAVVQGHQFLYDLLDPKKTPRVPSAVRRRASDILRHYPYPVVVCTRYAESGAVTEDEAERLWNKSPQS